MRRFTQADTIIPGAGNSSAWDRYAYTLNNPLRYTDPSGHSVDCGLGESGCQNKPTYINPDGSEPSKDDSDEVNWPNVVEDLNTEADRIRNDLAEQLLADVIGEAVMTGGGWAIGGLKCPGAAKLYCSAAGAIVGFVSSFYVSYLADSVMTSRADSYDKTASLILNGMTSESSQVNLHVEHRPELSIGIKNPALIVRQITIPEHYVLSVDGADGQVVLSSGEYNYVSSIIQSNIGP
ncbi:MAG: hypothetical protein IPN96_03990 [Anaerolineales bacterium]|nr:hypothetical protein [Anaerolineales bacterium]